MKNSCPRLPSHATNVDKVGNTTWFKCKRLDLKTIIKMCRCQDGKLTTALVAHRFSHCHRLAIGRLRPGLWDCSVETTLVICSRSPKSPILVEFADLPLVTETCKHLNYNKYSYWRFIAFFFRICNALPILQPLC